jgi:hypothetical protein
MNGVLTRPLLRPAAATRTIMSKGYLIRTMKSLVVE